MTADGSSAQPGTGVGTDTAAGPGEGASGGEGGAGAVALSVGPPARGHVKITARQRRGKAAESLSLVTWKVTFLKQMGQVSGLTSLRIPSGTKGREGMEKRARSQLSCSALLEQRAGEGMRCRAPPALLR